MASNIQTAASNAMAKNSGKPKGLGAYIEDMKPAIAAALPSVMTPERFARIATSAVSASPKLQECTPVSFLAAMMTAAQLGLEPNTPLGQAYLIPYGKECQFQIGYKGLIDLAYRSGEVSIIQAHTVRKNDVFEYELGLDPKLRHVPAVSDRGEAVAYYAMFKTKDGGYGFHVMSRQEVEEFAKKKSKTYRNGPWQTDFDEMAKKTVLKKVLKYAPLKSDFARAVAQDETVKHNIDADMFTVENDAIVDADEIPAADPATGEVIDNG